MNGNFINQGQIKGTFNQIPIVYYLSGLLLPRFTAV